MGTIVAVDLLPIVTIPGVTIIRGDFLLIKKLLATGDNPSGKADVSPSDMVANVCGNTAFWDQSCVRVRQAGSSFCR